MVSDEQASEVWEPEPQTRRLPIYLLLDTSWSMRDEPIKAVNEGLQAFEKAIKKDMHAIETAHVSVLTFSTGAKVQTPLTAAPEFEAPHLEADGRTQLGEGVSLLRERMEEEVRTRSEEHIGDWKPMVFFFTDGGPTDAWKRKMNKFRSTEIGEATRFFAVGCGPEIYEDVIERLADERRALVAEEISEKVIKDLFDWITQSVQTASRPDRQRPTQGESADQDKSWDTRQSGHPDRDIPEGSISIPDAPDAFKLL